MRQTTLLAGISLLTLAAGVALPASAQTTRETTVTTERYYMPYQKDFWSYIGANIGQSKLKDSDFGISDDTDTGFKIYGGGKFRDWLGLEVGYMNFGKAKLANGGEEKAQGLNVQAVVGLPLGANSSIFAKGGAAYTRADVIGAKVNGWEPSYGAGAAIGLNRNWQIRLDWDRVRFEVPNGKDNFEMVSAGLQYRY
jgi:OOP family OmpA-OmpF porin